MMSACVAAVTPLPRCAGLFLSSLEPPSRRYYSGCSGRGSAGAGSEEGRSDRGAADDSLSLSLSHSSLPPSVRSARTPALLYPGLPVFNTLLPAPL